MKDKIRRIANHYRFERQSRQLAIECAELTQSVNKYHNFRESKTTRDEILVSRDDNNMLIQTIVEKMADVEILIDEIKHLLNINPEAIEEIKKLKVNTEIATIEQEGR